MPTPDGTAPTSEEDLWCAACGKWGDHQSGRCPKWLSPEMDYGGPPTPVTRERWPLFEIAAAMLDAHEGYVPVDPDATVLVSCMHCEAMIEVRTGCRGIDDALSAGWEMDGAGDLRCPRCSEAQAEMIGEDER